LPAVAEALSYLYHDHLAPPAIRIRALPARYVDMKLMARDEIDVERAIRSLPPVIRGYLRLGAVVGDGAVIDRAFNTTDVAVVLRRQQVEQGFGGGFGDRDVPVE
jgi:putative hemolysin